MEEARLSEKPGPDEGKRREESRDEVQDRGAGRVSAGNRRVNTLSNVEKKE